MTAPRQSILTADMSSRPRGTPGVLQGTPGVLHLVDDLDRRHVVEARIDPDLVQRNQTVGRKLVVERLDRKPSPVPDVGGAHDHTSLQFARPQPR